MQVKLFTIPLFGSEEAVEEMNKFLRGNKVVDITKSLVQQGDVAYWSFCVTYLLGVPPFFRICNAEEVNISICNAKKQRYAAFVLWQPPYASFTFFLRKCVPVRQK